jgi:hypothetical protein
MKWHPIETAPRDGTWFMIINAREGYFSVEVGQYRRYCRYEYVQETSGLFRKVEHEVLEETFNNFHRATHWMPLPPPPEVET